MTCPHFTTLTDERCAAGVHYLNHAGGGVFTAVYRLPCVPLSDRKGHEVQRCWKYQEPKEKAA